MLSKSALSRNKGIKASVDDQVMNHSRKLSTACVNTLPNSRSVRALVTREKATVNYGTNYVGTGVLEGAKTSIATFVHSLVKTFDVATRSEKQIVKTAIYCVALSITFGTRSSPLSNRDK